MIEGAGTIHGGNRGPSMIYESSHGDRRDLQGVGRVQESLAGSGMLAGSSRGLGVGTRVYF